MSKRDEYILQLIPEDPILKHVKTSMKLHKMPEISISPYLGDFLTLLVHLSCAKRILEIGALGGYSTICLARALSAEGHVTSLEQNAEFIKVAKENIKKANLEDKVTYIIGNARETIEELRLSQAIFDLIFIDADKQNYPHYLNTAIQLSHPGTVIVADNIFLRDRVLDEQTTAPSPLAMQTFNRLFCAHPQLEPVLLPLGDGVALARVLDI